MTTTIMTDISPQAYRAHIDDINAIHDIRKAEEVLKKMEKVLEFLNGKLITAEKSSTSAAYEIMNEQSVQLAKELVIKLWRAFEANREALYKQLNDLVQRANAIDKKSGIMPR